MNTKGIEILLEKYFEGETSLSEELQLKEFFQNEDLPEHLLKHRAVFTYFVTASRETSAEKLPVFTLLPRPNRFYYISGIAAGVLLLIGLFFTFQHDIFKKTRPNKPYNENEMAFNQARVTLLMVSASFNTGFDQMQRFVVFDKAIQNAQILNKFYQCQTLIINPDEQANQSTKP